MNNRILWVEDDYYHIQGLMRPLIKKGISVDFALNGFEAYNKCKNWKKYDFIIIDLILPLTKDNTTLPEEVKTWEREQYVGIGLIKWLRNELRATFPIIVLSVNSNVIDKYELADLRINANISKMGVSPSNLLISLEPFIR